MLTCHLLIDKLITNHYQLCMIMCSAFIIKFDIGTDRFCNKNTIFLIFWSRSRSQSLRIVKIGKVRKVTSLISTAGFNILLKLQKWQVTIVNIAIF